MFTYSYSEVDGASAASETMYSVPRMNRGISSNDYFLVTSGTTKKCMKNTYNCFKMNSDGLCTECLGAKFLNATNSKCESCLDLCMTC